MLKTPTAWADHEPVIHQRKSRPVAAVGPGNAGFSLIELLVVMLIMGVLAAIVIPSFLLNKAKAQESAVKSDVKQIVKEVVSYYIDGTGALTVSNSADGRTWRVLDTAGLEVASGPLSQHNSVVGSGVIASDNAFCVSIQSDLGKARVWQATPAGLAPGGC